MRGREGQKGQLRDTKKTVGIPEILVKVPYCERNTRSAGNEHFDPDSRSSSGSLTLAVRRSGGARIGKASSPGSQEGGREAEPSRRGPRGNVRWARPVRREPASLLILTRISPRHTRWRSSCDRPTCRLDESPPEVFPAKLRCPLATTTRRSDRNRGQGGSNLAVSVTKPHKKTTFREELPEILCYHL